MGCFPAVFPSRIRCKIASLIGNSRFLLFPHDSVFRRLGMRAGGHDGLLSGNLESHEISTVGG